MNLDRELSSLGLPDDVVEVALHRATAPDLAARARIRSMVLAQQMDPRHPSRSLRPRRWVIPLAAGIVLLALIGPATGYALFLRFVPGLGVMSSPEVSEALAQAVHVKGPGYSAWVTGVLANASGTFVNLTVDQAFSAPAGATIRDSAGRIYHLQGYWWGTGNTSGGSLSFPPLRAPTRRLVLTLPFAGTLTVTIPLVPKTRLLGAQQFGPVATKRGVTLGARVERIGDRMLVSILAEASPTGTEATSFGGFSDPPLLILPDGHTIALNTSISTSSGALAEFSLPVLPSDIHAVTVIVPSVTVQAQSGTAYSQIPLPTRGPLRLSQPLSLGPVGTRITGVRLLGRSRLLVMFSSHGAEQFGEPITVTANGQSVSAIATLTQEGGLMTLEFPVRLSLRSASVLLGIANPSTVVFGPWRILVPVSQVP